MFYSWTNCHILYKCRRHLDETYKRELISYKKYTREHRTLGAKRASYFFFTELMSLCQWHLFHRHSLEWRLLNPLSSDESSQNQLYSELCAWSLRCLQSAKEKDLATNVRGHTLLRGNCERGYLSRLRTIMSLRPLLSIVIALYGCYILLIDYPCPFSIW